MLKMKSCWTEEYSIEESITFLRRLALRHADRAGRHSTDLRKHILRGDWAALLSMDLDFRYDDTPEHVYNAQQVKALFSKFEGLPLVGVNKQSVALGKFFEAEALCQQTNEIFRSHFEGSYVFKPSIEAILFLATRKISRILGDVPPISALDLTFGPGATTTTQARVAQPCEKLGSALACSDELLSSVGELLREMPGWVSAHSVHTTDISYAVDVEIHVGRLQLVPKNAKTYRSIVVEPVLNSMLQRGYGKYIRRRLKRWGLDLDDQGRNQSLARMGSITGFLATLDLSSASDTVSKGVVEHLLPYDWWRALSASRTGSVSIARPKGGLDVHRLHKFSSMGNGYTFELESLIFWTLALATCEYLHVPSGWTRCYGDDIIIPTDAVPLLKEVLTATGFIVNDQKSFAIGPYRESCGKDYFLGIDVRPAYVKNVLSPASLFTLHNFYKRRHELELAQEIVEVIHPALRLYGPDGYGDGHLISDDRSCLNPVHRDRGWRGSTFDTFTLRSRKLKRLSRRGLWVLPVYSVYSGATRERSVDHKTIRGFTGYRRLSIYMLNP